jgi:hypothetical protein
MSASRNPDARADLALASRNAGDAHLESVLNAMTSAELNTLQSLVIEQLRRGLPSVEQIAKALEGQDVDVAAWFRFREAQYDAVKVVMLLGALGVAVAWRTHRHLPAPHQRLQDAIARVGEDHVYMLPIPRTAPCFCGSGSYFKSCHGKVPLAAPAI